MNHKDGNKANNHVDNLEWVNKSMNEKHAYSTGLKNAVNKKAVLQYSPNGELLAEYSSLAEAELKTGILQSSISISIKRKPKNPKTFIWKFK